MVFWLDADHDIEITNRFLSTARTTCKLDTFNTRKSLDSPLKRRSVFESNIQSPSCTESREQFNSIEHSLFRFLSKPLHWRNMSLFSSLFETCNRIDAQFFMHQFDSFWTEARNTKHFDHALRCIFMQTNPIFRPSSFKNCLRKG